MINIKKLLTGSVASILFFGLFATAAYADATSVNFETYSLGNINTQDGWSKTGPYDVNVVSNSYGFTSFDNQSLRISNAITSGSFGDQTFSKSLVNEAGETDAQTSSYSGGARQTHFETQFDIASTSPNQQPGLAISVSPDRGDGARMGYLRFVDDSDGIHVFFDDYQDAMPYGTLADPSNGCGTDDDWIENDIATLDRSKPHTIKISMDFVDGPRNDIVKVYVDGVWKHTGTSWEDYFRWCTESGGGVVNNPNSDVSRTVDSVLFRSAGTAVPGNQEKGFLIDNFSESSSTPVAICPAGTTKSSSPVDTVTVDSRSSTPTIGNVNLTNGKKYLFVSSGTWINSNNLADAEYTSTDGWSSHMNGYDLNPYFLGEGAFDLKVNSSFVNWGSYDGTDHRYSLLYSGTGSKANFLIFDGDSSTNNLHPEWYGDNTGNLLIDVYSCETNKPTDANQCKKDGWKTFTNPSFKNQGDCVSYVNANVHATGNRKDN